MRVRLQADVNLFIYVESDVVATKRFRGRLYHTNTGKSWAATSGPFGNGAAPKGEYTFEGAKDIDPAAPENKSFLDPAGNAWFAAITPAFQTKRTSLGMHPDGGVPGTEGCIGIVEKDTAELRNLLNEPGVLYVL